MKKINMIWMAAFTLLLGSQQVFAEHNLVTIDRQSTQDTSCPVPPKQSRVLKCSTYIQTTRFTCGPAAVMTLMNYYGKLSRGEMNRQTELRIAGEMGAQSGAGGGTTLSQVSGWLSDHGFSVSTGTRIDSDTLINNVNKGMLTLVAYNDHWILAKGYQGGSDNNSTKIIFSDSCCGTNVISAHSIDSMWQEASLYPKACGSNIGAYIEATPS